MPCGLSYEGPHQQLGMCLIPVSIKSRPVYDDGRRLRFTVPRTGSQIVHPNRRPLSSTAIFRFRPSCLRALWRHRRDPHYNNGGSQAVSCPGGNGNAARYGKVAVRRRPGHPRASGGRDSRLRPWLRRAGRRAESPIPAGPHGNSPATHASGTSPFPRPNSFVAFSNRILRLSASLISAWSMRALCIGEK